MRRHTLRGVASKFECQAGTTPRCLLTCSGRQYNSMSRNGLQSSASERDNPGEVRPLLESKEMHECTKYTSDSVAPSAPGSVAENEIGQQSLLLPRFLITKVPTPSPVAA